MMRTAIDLLLVALAILFAGVYLYRRLMPGKAGGRGKDGGSGTACGGCANCGADANPAAAADVSVPVESIQRRR